MPYNFLTLTNDVNKAMNEVELTASNFASAIGFHAHVKDGINTALRQINQEAFEWPFNHVTQELVLTPGTNRYTFPADFKTCDFDAFRLKRDDTLQIKSTKLSILTYEDYLERFLDQEDSPDESTQSIPRYVFRTPDHNFGISPAPNKAYTLRYEYYKLPVDLVLHSDVPTVPENFRNVLFEGAMVYAHAFRGDTEASELSGGRFKEGIKNMRSIYINRYEYARSTVRDR